MKLGLTPLNTERLPYGRQSIDEDDCQAVLEALRSSNLTQGIAVDLFEDEIKKITGARYAVAVTNGTAALHLAVLALQIPEGSSAITTQLSFAASANALAYCGLKVGFTEVESDSGLMDVKDLEQQLERRQREGQPVRVVIPVHYTGQVCDMERIWQLRDKYNFHIIEDASHALGASYGNGKLVGSGRSEFATISFHPVKHIATGEGGIILTNDKDLYERVKTLRSHGIVKDEARYLNQKEAIDPLLHKPYPWYYEMQMLGFNYRLPDLNAALGVSQARKFPNFLERRKEIAACYDNHFTDNPYFDLLNANKYGANAYHLYVILLKSEQLLQKKTQIFERLWAKGIGTQVHYIPIPMLPFYQSQGFEATAKARLFYRRCLSIPMYPDLNEKQQQYVIQTLSSVLEGLATKG